VSAARRSPPSRPSLEQQKKLARDLLRAFRSGDEEAAARVREHLPDKATITLADAQFVLAREYGFRNWAALKSHIEGKTAATPPASLHEAFRHAFDRGDAAEVRALFDRYPEARAVIDAPVFPFATPALGEVHQRGDAAMVEILLEHGADPNRRTGWWAGPFHVLHVANGDVAARLIEAGAVPDACAAANLDRPDLLRCLLDEDPSRVHERGGDGQTPLHFARSREVIDLLLERGADPDAHDVDHRSTPAQWMLEQRRGAGRYALAEYLVERGASVDVFLAAALGLADRLRGMLEADPLLMSLRTAEGEYGERPPSADHIYTWTIGQHLSPLQVAAQFGHDPAVEVLRAFASPRDRLVAACMTGSAEEARALLRASPGLIAQLTPDDARILPDAAWAGNATAVGLMLDVGFPADARGMDGGTVLHCAAWQGDAGCIETALRHDRVRSLIEARDSVHDSTPLGWCCHGSRYRANPEGDYPGVARLLLDAGARPGPNLGDATEEVRVAIGERDILPC
jgi:ankyrin repeat protein